jgi:putative membrane protein
MNIRLVVIGSSTALVMCLGLGWAVGQDGDSRQLAGTDKAFLDDVAAGDKSEIDLGTVAAGKALAPAVRSLAQQMVAEHGNNFRELQTLGGKKNYPIAAQPEANHGELLDKLVSADSGEAFDREYLDAVVADHALMQGVLERIANDSNDSDIVRFAADTLAAAKKHEQMAKALASR